MHKVLFSKKSVHWSTPVELYNDLNREFIFDDDPCPLHGVNGLNREWGNSVYVNPPYNNIKGFLDKAFEQLNKKKMYYSFLSSFKNGY